MIIDFHTHTFPEQIAARTIAKLSASSNLCSYLNGTAKELTASMQANGINYSVLLPVATKPSQTDTINQTAIQVNNRFRKTGLLSFGGIHPDNENYREILKNLSENGIKGIKLHPVFQNTYFDDIRYLRIIECACEYNLIVLTHAGYDVSFPNDEYSSPKHILPVIEQIHPDKLVLAHMGGWHEWNLVLELLAGQHVWLDTSFSLTPMRPSAGANNTPDSDTAVPTDTNVSPDPNVVWPDGQLSKEAFCRLVRKHGSDKILFGTDSPWSSQAESLRLVRESGLNQTELDQILYKNAQALLDI